MIPLLLRMKKESHRVIARAHDIIVEELYTVFPTAVLHGGTAIWRCYNGKRFSEDIDVYIQKDIKKIELLFSRLEKRGLRIEKKKIGENSLFSNLLFERTVVRLEALFKKVNGSLKEYETADGNLLTVYTLTPEEFIREKIAAYTNRLKIRDLYDIFYMLRFVKELSSIQKELGVFARDYKKPVDENELKILILEGVVPTSTQMIESIKQA